MALTTGGALYKKYKENPESVSEKELCMRYEHILDTYASEKQRKRITLSSKELARTALPATYTPSIVFEAERRVDDLIREVEKSDGKDNN